MHFKSAIPLFLALFGVYLTSFHGYLLFHGLAEIFSIVIACGIFMVAWNARNFFQSPFLLFIGIAYLFVGGIDLLHTFAFKGMGVFPGNDANLPTQLWIVARYTEAFSLLAATFFIRRKLNALLTFCCYGLATGLTLASILYWNIFPDCFIEGVGLTPFKIYSEYVICMTLIAAAVFLFKNRKEFERSVLVLLIAAILTAVIQEIAFTTYLSVYGSSNMVGHLLKIVSFSLIYKAIIETSLVSPYDLLFRDLKQSEERFRFLFEEAPIPYQSLDEHGRIHNVNQTWLQSMGYQREDEVVGKEFGEFLSHRSRKDFTEKFPSLKSDGQFRGLEFEMIRRDGSAILASFDVNIARDVRGEVKQTHCTFLDIGEARRLDQELRRSRDGLELRVQERTADLSATITRLELLNRELSEFAFIASHDLQEPLRKIQVFCDRAVKRCGAAIDSTSQDYLHRVVNSATRMRHLLQDLLAYSRSTEPQGFKELDVRSIILEAASVYEQLIEDTSAVIDTGEMPLIEADESQMIQLFQNLIGNSLKYRSDRPPHISITANLNGSRTCEFCISDNGIGFEQQYAELIFKPFQRLHGRREYEGTGIGLSICRKIVERHGGTIRANSEPDKGSTFIIRLPLKQMSL